MLNHEDNELLCRVENGAPMGQLMRQYWLPAFRAGDLEAGGRPRQIKLLGERLVVFRDTAGQVGVLDEYCPHRGASLSLARNVDSTLQCLYHGWRIDRNGTVVETPSEPADSTFKDRIRHVSYPVREAGGLVWTYLGRPEDEPEFPAFEWTNVPLERVCTLRIIERCNWAQALEGVIDSAHIGFLHRDMVAKLASGDEEAYTGGGGLISQIISDGHPKLEAENTTYGFTYAAIRSATFEGERVAYVRRSHFVAPFWGMFPGPEGYGFQQAFVPIDDYTTAFYFINHKTDGTVIDDVERQKIHAYAGAETIDDEFYLPNCAANGWLQDRDAMTRGESFTGLWGKAQVEDFAVQESLGPIFDRSREHLGTSDVACIRMRRLMLDAARGVADGTSQLALGRDFRYDAIRAEEGIIPPDGSWKEIGALRTPEQRRATAL